MTTVTKKILVVEDDRVMSRVFRFVLERADLEVTICHSARKAVAILEDNQFDVIMTDFQMPGMTGEELCRYIRGCVRHADVPVFMITAKGYELDIPGLVEELSLTKVFFKPFSPKEVVQSVKQVLEQAVV